MHYIQCGNLEVLDLPSRQILAFMAYWESYRGMLLEACCRYVTCIVPLLNEYASLSLYLYLAIVPNMELRTFDNGGVLISGVLAVMRGILGSAGLKAYEIDWIHADKDCEVVTSSERSRINSNILQCIRKEEWKMKLIWLEAGDVVVRGDGGSGLSWA
jgi:hypothetical protein